ncbi:MAG: hypothetical protein ACUVQG_14545, partial [Thermogutta sp.]
CLFAIACYRYLFTTPGQNLSRGTIGAEGSGRLFCRSLRKADITKTITTVIFLLEPGSKMDYVDILLRRFVIPILSVNP